jgi:hypothetical protein
MDDDEFFRWSINREYEEGHHTVTEYYMFYTSFNRGVVTREDNVIYVNFGGESARDPSN